jgi:hypothetical protein
MSNSDAVGFDQQGRHSLVAARSLLPPLRIFSGAL